MIFFYLSSLIPSASAGAIDEGAEMIARGIDAYEDYKATKILESNFGVSFDNVEDVEDKTPSQKLVYMIAAATQSPFKVEWVRETWAHDFIYYILISVLIIALSWCLEIAQKDYPEKIDAISNRFTGHSSVFDYSVSFKTALKLGLGPIVLFFIIDTLVSFEQALSSGLMLDSIEYISLTADKAGIWFFETMSYGMTGWFFASRIQYVNLFTAHSLKIILMFVIPWGWLYHVAGLLSAWFCSALFMRPIVLYYSSSAVKDLAGVGILPNVTSLDPNDAYDAVWSSVGTAGAQTAAEMTTVSILTFVTAMVLVVGPLLYAIFKILIYYAVGQYKAAKISTQLNKIRRSRD
ncbi:MAG: hypothetical protein LLG05_10120 [Porphyromonadaceae bacterium]|nr:hypothetical protein [Porphyromonadaceae bacterium]